MQRWQRPGLQKTAPLSGGTGLNVKFEASKPSFKPLRCHLEPVGDRSVRFFQRCLGIRSRVFLEGVMSGGYFFPTAMDRSHLVPSHHAPNVQPQDAARDPEFCVGPVCEDPGGSIRPNTRSIMMEQIFLGGSSSSSQSVELPLQEVRNYIHTCVVSFGTQDASGHP